MYGLTDNLAITCSKIMPSKQRFVSQINVSVHFQPKFAITTGSCWPVVMRESIFVTIVTLNNLDSTKGSYEVKWTASGLFDPFAITS